MIYCVEDDNGIRDLMTYTLAVSGYEAKGFPDSAGLWEALHTVRPELIMLDIMLPGEDGITILKKLRESSATADIPVIMATAKGTEYDKVIGLDLGADDYLAKPFGMMEMVSRVRAVLRRSAPHSSGVLTVGPIALDVVRHRVTVGGNEVTLTLKEFELLRLFAENKGVVFTRDQLLAHIWGVDYIGETRTVDVHIGTLRTKLGDAGELIETVRGVGYRMEER
ncbi:MAG: winged helix-turn-helix domain-containing protein [Christensenellales bacterium]